MPRFQVKIEDANGRMRPFEVAVDPRTQQPQWTSHRLPPIHITLYQQTAEARYANALLGGGASSSGSVYAQDDLSGGIGKKLGVRQGEPFSDRYYYGDWLDASVTGQVQKGAKVTVLATPTNSVGLVGFFVLGGVPYLSMGEIVGKWNSGPDTITQAFDWGGGVAGGKAAMYFQLGATTHNISQLLTTTTFTLDSSDTRIAQRVALTAQNTAFLSSMNLQLKRRGLAAAPTPSVVPQGTGGAATWGYKISALSGVDETAVGAQGSTAAGNATLTASNYNAIVWAQVPNATGYKVYRTVSGGTPGSLGLIGLTTGVTFNDTGILGDGSTPPTTDATGKVPGDVRLSLVADKGGDPNGIVIASARRLASTIPLTQTTVEFKFEDIVGQSEIPLGYRIPYWFVLDAAGVTPASVIDVYVNGGADNYTNGYYETTTDGGNLWATSSPSDMYFDLIVRLPTTTAFIGSNTTGHPFKTTSDGVTFIDDTGSRLAADFAVVGSRLIRVPQDIASSAGTGTIEYSDDGMSWNGDLILVGDPTVPIVKLEPMGDTLVVIKEDGIYVVDILDTALAVQQLYANNAGARNATNGLGSCFWRNAVYVPFGGRLLAVEGDFTNGFTVHESIGLEALPEWDWPWGAGFHTACVGTRSHLYSIVKTGTFSKLFKSSNPLRKNQDGTADPQWHGSLCDVDSNSITISTMGYYDGGGSGSPQLFCPTGSTTSIARIQLPRSFNPASDSTYPYDTAHVADLYLPQSTAGYPVHPKAWLTETATFAKATPSDYIESMYDLLDGEGWRRLPQGRLYDTGALPYPRNASSRLIARRVRLNNSLSTASPLLMAFAVAWAARPIGGAQVRELTFSIVAEDDLNGSDVGEMLGIGAASIVAIADGATADRLTRRIEDPYGTLLDRCIILDASVQLTQFGRDDSGGRSVIQISAISVGT